MRNDGSFTLKRNGYDPFVDFLKGICIFLVILTHCLPYFIRYYILFPLWGNIAVPIFLMIQVFHAIKKGYDNVNVNYSKLWHRIIKPFVLVECVIILLSLIMMRWGGQIVWDEFFYFIMKNGGLGHGCFFPWVFIQFAIIIPLAVPLFKRLKGWELAIGFVVISELFEILSSLICIPEYVYRLIFLRYVMLIYLGYILTMKGYAINIKTFIISILSLTSLCFCSYSDIDFSPFIFNSKWRSCHWMCYFYILYLVMFLLSWLYKKGLKKQWLGRYIKKMGRCSYEIFLFQLFYFALLHSLVVETLSLFFMSKIAAHSIATILVFVICIGGVVAFHDWRKKYKREINVSYR